METGQGAGNRGAGRLAGWVRLVAGLVVAAVGLAACAPSGGAPAPLANPPAGRPVAAATAAPSPPPRERLVVAYSQRSVSQGMHIYGLEAGYFAQQGLELETTQIPGSSVLAAAMIAGEVHIGTVGASAPTEARLGGADLVMLADTTPVMVFWLIGRPEVRAVAELRGKRIGVTRLGTALHLGGRLALRHHGLDPEREVTWMNMSTLSAIVAGLEANAVDAGVVTPIEKYQAQALGMQALFDIGTISPPFSQAGVVASQQFTRERPDLILRYLRGHLDGLKRLRADPAWGKQVMARWLQVDDPVVIDDSYDTYVRRYLPEIPLPRPEAVAPIIELLALTDPRASQLRPEDVIEPRFIQQLEAEGFFRRPPGGS